VAEPGGWWRGIRGKPRSRWTLGAATVAGVAIAATIGWPLLGADRDDSEIDRPGASARAVELEADNASLRSEATRLRTRNSELESELAIARSAQEAMAKQTADLSAEIAELKEQAAFLHQLVGEAGPKQGLSIARLAVERQADDLWRYSLLVVRGGSPRDEFAGRLVLQATLQGPEAAGEASELLTLPDAQPDTAPALELAFRYYQRVEGSFRVPPGARVTALEARVFDRRGGSPRAVRTVQNGLANP
jgi:hypothetical protein